MRRLSVYIKIIVVMGCCCGCMPNNDKCLQKLLKDTGIEECQIQVATHLVIIPGNGCGRCIDKAISEIHVSQDTLYVVTCHSEKEFYLLTDRHRDDFPNVYLDTDEVAASMKMVGTTPMVYALKGGKFISRAPYQQVTSDDHSSVVQTTLTVDKKEVNWGDLIIRKEKKPLLSWKTQGMIVYTLLISFHLVIVCRWSVPDFMFLRVIHCS